MPLSATCLTTMYFERAANGKFQEKTLPLQVQFAPVYTITALDFNKDGHQDLLFCGNENRARLRFGKSDANYGILLQNNGTGGFNYVPQRMAGFHLRGDVRSVTGIQDCLLFGINQGALAAYKLR
jgi:enediyne biosynthesis protein E4